MFREVKKDFRNLSLMLLIVTAAFLLWGCSGGGESSYDAPATTSNAPLAGHASNVLIEPATLKTWIDQDLVNDSSYENVVILQVGSFAKYGVAHIPGAGLWDGSTELNTAGRIDGLAADGRLVVDGPTIDAMLQRNCVDNGSTIVLTYADTENYYYPARAYFMLRYWGFPKERIKFLNGGNAAWNAAITANGWGAEYALTTDIDPVAASTFSVANNDMLNDDLRTSISEMIQAVDANNASIASTGEAAINIVQQTNSSTRTIANAIGRHYSWFAVDAVTSGGSFLPADELEAALLDSDGPDDSYDVGEFVEGLPNIVHCASGMSTAPIFFVMDAILDLDVSLFDGSTNQWKAYYGDPAGSDMYINDAWNVNLDGRSTVTTALNTASGISDITDAAYSEFEYIIPLNNLLFQTVDDPRANQVEIEDLEYMDDGSDSAPTASSGDSGGDC